VSATANELFNVNVEALRARSPELAAAVVSATPIRLEAAIARSGAISARAGDGWLHSRYDPVSEGRKVADEAIATGAELIVMLGLGLGYSAKAALSAGAAVAVVEADPSSLAAALRLLDLSGLIADERCALLLCPGGKGLGAFLEAAAPRSIALIENAAAMALFPEAAKELRAQVARYRKKDEINAATLRRFGRLWVRNLSRNVRVAAGFSGVSSFAGSFAGMPAVVLAAGPSLDEVVPSLRAIKGRALVVCVDTALRTALAAGVEPDFIVVVDPQYWNARHLDRCESPGSVLVTEAAVWPSVLRFGSRRTALCSSIYPLGRYVEARLGPPKGALGAGGSVATTAWDFARITGCAPIFMAGLDLAFPGGRTHARASLFEQRALAESLRLSPASSASFEAMRGGRPFLASANDGSPVTSDERLSLYSTWFARKTAAHPEAPTFNLSGRGLAIEGMPYASVATILRLPLIRATIDARLSEALREAERSAPDPGKTVDDILDGLREELSRLAELSDRAVLIAERASGASGPTLAAALAELERIDEDVLRSGASEVVGFLFTSAAEAIGGRARTLDESLEHTARLYGAVAETARWHSGSLA